MHTVSERDRLIDIPGRSLITGESRSLIYDRMKRKEITVVKRGRRTLLSEAEAYADVSTALAAAREASGAA